MPSGITIRGNPNILNQRLSAIRLVLETPEPMLIESAQRLSELLEEYAPGSALSTGLLKQAFRQFRLYRTGSGKNVNAVGIGDPAILTKPQSVAGAGYIKEFVEWLRSQNAPKYKKYAKAQARGSKQRSGLKRQIRNEKIAIRGRVKKSIAKTRARKSATGARREKSNIAKVRTSSIRRFVEEFATKPGFGVKSLETTRVSEIRRLGQVSRAEVISALKYQRTRIKRGILGFKSWSQAEQHVLSIFRKAGMK